MAADRVHIDHEPRRRVRAVLVTALCAIAAVLSPLAGPAAAATPLSPGCAALDASFMDGPYMQAAHHNAFYANEQITITAGPPASGAPQAITLEVPVGVTVDTDGFPGTVSYTFPTDVITTVLWRAIPASSVTWAVSCGAPAVATTLEADPALLRFLPPRVTVGSVSARLTSSDTGLPIAGEPVVFSSDGTTLCTAVTSANGTAGCTLTLAGSLAVIANGGFTGTYAGSDDFLPSTDTAPLIG